MGTYYMSVCHDCEKSVMWAKCRKETAEKWHKNFHPKHNTKLGADYDDEFYSVYASYEHKGIVDGEEIKVDSIKLSYEEWEAYQSEQHILYSGYEGRPVTEKIKEAGFNTEIGLHVYDTGQDLIVSNEPLKNPPPAPKREIISMDEVSKKVMTQEQYEEINRLILRSEVFIQEPEVNKTEVMNIFNELLDEWYGETICVIENMSGAITEEREATNLKKEEYIKRFKEALGVSGHE